MKRVVNVMPLSGFRVEVAFADGVRGVADLSDIAGKGVFSVWSDRAVFESVRIGDTGEVVWDGGLDLCPDSLYLKITGKRVQDVFPALNHQALHA